MSFKNLDLLSPDLIYTIAPNKRFEVEEKKDAGKGVCYFVSNDPVLFIKAKYKSPIIWSIRNKKCAEAAFIIKKSEDELELHIVEMKSKLSSGDFLKVIDQWKGMYLSSLGVMGIIKLRPPSKVIVYVAYKQETVTTINHNPSQPIFGKVLVGLGLPAGGQEWRDEEVTLHHGVIAKIVKGQRTPEDVDFGTV